MSILSTTYMGIDLKNPILISSSGLTNNPEKIKLIEQQGAGGVILKSLFEEQINYEIGILHERNSNPFKINYISNYGMENSISEYLNLIECSKKEVEIPIFASINCISSSKWINHAKRIEDSGADGLELNIHIIPTDINISSEEIEEIYLDIIYNVKSKISIPIAVKISNNFTNILNFIQKLEFEKTEGVVLFNKFFEPDIDIEELKMKPASIFSNPSDFQHTFRWIGIVDAFRNKIEISASTGIHNSESAIKAILAGAQTVQLCSVLYQKGLEEISIIIKQIEDWMIRMNFNSIDSFRGLLSYKNKSNHQIYERSQFIKYFSEIE